MDTLPYFGRGVGLTQAIEAKKTLAGKDFGELVRERWRLFGLLLPMADKALSFRPTAGSEAPSSADPIEADEARVSGAWARLAEAERSGHSPRHLRTLEAEYLDEPATLRPRAERGLMM